MVIAFLITFFTVFNYFLIFFTVLTIFCYFYYFLLIYIGILISKKQVYTCKANANRNANQKKGYNLIVFHNLIILLGLTWCSGIA